MSEIVSIAKKVFDTEIEGLEKVRDSLGTEFEKAVQLCESTLQAGGKLVLTGIGKSAHISRKIAATLMSTGSHSVFLYPVEAMHGDLGILSKGDLIIAVSYSGETNELLAVIPAFKNLGHKILAVTGKPESRLAKLSDAVLPMTVEKEACPYNLAPTTSTTALLALGDALAEVLMDMHSFTKSDYGMLHPAGAIGRSLTFKAKDIMQTFKIPPILRSADISISNVVKTLMMSQSPLLVLENSAGAIENVLLASDVCSVFSIDKIASWKAGEMQFWKELSKKTSKALLVFDDILAVEVLKMMNNAKKDYAVVTDGYRKFVGVISRNDLKTFKV